LDPQGPIASAERLLLINSTAIMLVVVIPVIVATLAFAWWSWRSIGNGCSSTPIRMSR
jgi:heme/copper-type cytochrome/quinol oxidase subunit 2